MGDDDQPSGYLSSLRSNAPKARRAVTINIENPFNLAPAYPSFHIGIDAKKLPQQGTFPVTMSKLDALDSASLIASALKPGPSRTLKPKTPQGSKQPAQAYLLGVDAAPGRSTPLAEYEQHDFSAADRRRGAASSNRKRRRNGGSGLGEDGDGEDEPVTPVTRKKARQVPSLKSVNLTTNPGCRANPNSKSSTQLSTGFRTPAKLRDTAVMKERGIPIPKNLDDAGEADKMLMAWKAEGKRWADIKKEWTRITGRETGESTLSCRHLKIQENIVAYGGEYDFMILKAKEQAQKEARGPLWDRVSEVIKEKHNVDLRPFTCRRRYFSIKATGADRTQNSDEQMYQEARADYNVDSVVSRDEVQSALRNAQYKELDTNEPEQTMQGSEDDFIAPSTEELLRGGEDYSLVTYVSDEASNDKSDDE